MSHRWTKPVIRSLSRKSLSYITSTVPAQTKAGENSIYRKSPLIQTRRSTVPVFKRTSGRHFLSCQRKYSKADKAKVWGAQPRRVLVSAPSPRRTSFWDRKIVARGRRNQHARARVLPGLPCLTFGLSFSLARREYLRRR